jgi:hypothetical protein
MVCPHGKTVTSYLDSNKNCKPFEIQHQLGPSHYRPKTIILNHKEQTITQNKSYNLYPNLKADRAVMMHRALYTGVAILQKIRVAAAFMVDSTPRTQENVIKLVEL